MSSSDKDFYSILKVDKTASPDEIKKAFRKIARKFHPDVAGSFNQAASDAKFKAATGAYEVLSDPEKRRQYDELGVDWQQEGPSRSGARGRTRQGSSRNPNSAGFDFSDFFEQSFGREEASGFGGRAGPSREYPERGNDVEAELSVSFEEVLQGADRSVSLQKSNPYTGGASSNKYQVKIPKGIREGQRIRLTGQGDPGSGGGGAGDLFLRVRFASHAFLRNDKETLYYNLEITPWEAVLGASITIRTLDGSVRVKIPACSQNQQQLKLKGLGLPLSADTRGDLFVKLSVAVPKMVDETERSAWETLAESSQFKPRAD